MLCGGLILPMSKITLNFFFYRKTTFFFFISSRKLREAHPEVPQPSTSRRRSPIKGATSASYDHDLFEQKLQQAKNDIIRQKDEELAKMHIQIRKEMDDKLRIERNR